MRPEPTAGFNEDRADDLTGLPVWAGRERPMAAMLPYVSLVNDVTIRTRGNALFQCIRLEGVNSMTSEDAHLEKTRARLAAIIAQIGPEYGFYVHKVSKAIDIDLPVVEGDGFANAVDTRWRAGLDKAGLRDKTLTLTVMKRPPFGTRLPFRADASLKQLKAKTAKQLRKLDEVVGFLMSSFAEMRPRLLGAYCVEKLRFWLCTANFFAVQADKLLVARGSAKLVFRYSCASSRRLTNDLI